MDPELCSAIISNNIAAFQKAVEKDASSLDLRTKRDGTALHVACKFGRVALVELILGQRPDMLSSSNVHGQTPMHVACMRDGLQILKMLMESNQWMAAEVDNHGRSPLYMACFYDRVHLVEYLLQYRWIPGSDEDGSACLHLATRKCNDINIVRLLLEARPTLVLKADGNGNTALHIAVSYRRLRVAEYLINNTRVAVGARNVGGKTAFDIVAGYESHNAGSRTIQKLLVEKQGIQVLETRNDLPFPAKDFDPSYPKSPSRDQREDGREDGREEDEIHPEGEPTSHCSDNVGLERNKLKSMKRRKNLEKLYRKQQQEKVAKRRMYQEALQNARNTVVIVAVLIATVAFQAGVSPPGGVNDAGKSVLARTTAFKVFIVSNTAALSISLGIVIVLVSFIPFKRKPLVKILQYSHRAMWVAVSFMAIAFIAASWATLPSYPHDKADTKWMKAALVVGAGGGLASVFLGWGVMLCTHLKRKSKWRRTRILDSNQEAKRFGNEIEITGSSKSLADDGVRRLTENFSNYWSELSINSDVASSNELGYHPV